MGLKIMPENKKLPGCLAAAGERWLSQHIHFAYRMGGESCLVCHIQPCITCGTLYL